MSAYPTAPTMPCIGMLLTSNFLQAINKVIITNSEEKCESETRNFLLHGVQRNAYSETSDKAFMLLPKRPQYHQYHRKTETIVKKTRKRPMESS